MIALQYSMHRNERDERYQHVGASALVEGPHLLDQPYWRKVKVTGWSLLNFGVCICIQVSREPWPGYHGGGDVNFLPKAVKGGAPAKPSTAASRQGFENKHVASFNSLLEHAKD